MKKSPASPTPGLTQPQASLSPVPRDWAACAQVHYAPEPASCTLHPAPCTLHDLHFCAGCRLQGAPVTSARLCTLYNKLVAWL